MSRRRRRLAVALTILGTVSLVLSLVFVWAERNVFDPGRFADHAVETIDDDEVRVVIARQLTDQLVDSGPDDLLSFKPVIQAVVEGVIQTSAFKGLFRAAVIQLHDSLFDAESDSAVLVVADAGLTIISRLQVANPELAEQLPDDVEATLIEVDRASAATDASQIAQNGRVLAFLLPLATIGFFGGAVYLSANRRGAVRRIGVLTVSTGIGLALLTVVAITVLSGLASDPDASAALTSVLDAYLSPFGSLALSVAVLGMLLTAVATTLHEPIDIRDRVDRVVVWATREPETGGGRLARALALLAGGTFVILNWELVAKLAIWGVGLTVVFVGLNEAVALLAPVRPPGEAESGTPPPRHARPALRVLAAAAIVVAASAALWLGLRGSGSSSALPFLGEQECNGHAELCDRPIDEVVFAATHNSMSAAEEEGWLFAEHTGGLREQLDFGIRVFLIDTWYGTPTDQRGVVLTELNGDRTEEELRAEMGDDAVDAALRTNERLGDDQPGTSRQYLCHNLCELGATDLVESFSDMTTWLDDHPDEVVILFIQDQTTPEDFESAVEESGLIDLVYDGFDPDDPLTSEMPTLGEMIEQDQRVVILAEVDGGDVDWYYDGFTLAQETPYEFDSVEDFSCEPNRGREDSPFFGINHWIEASPPSQSAAREANAAGRLLDRARTCEAERGETPNWLAVNFYESGDVLAVVDELNGVG